MLVTHVVCIRISWHATMDISVRILRASIIEVETLALPKKLSRSVEILSELSRPSKSLGDVLSGSGDSWGGGGDFCLLDNLTGLDWLDDGLDLWLDDGLLLDDLLISCSWNIWHVWSVCGGGWGDSNLLSSLSGLSWLSGGLNNDLLWSDLYLRNDTWDVTACKANSVAISIRISISRGVCASI